MQAAVVISSLSRHHPDGPARIFVLHDGYESTLQDRVATSARGVELVWIAVPEDDRAGLRLPEGHYLSGASLFRLRLGELLPENVERVIYLDADVVVLQPLDDLWNFDLSDTMVGAVRDATVPWVAAPRGLDWQQFGLAPDQPYFSVGVMVVPVARWREHHVGEQAIELLAMHRLAYADQCALNIVTVGRVSLFPPRWNLQAGHVRDGGSLAWITEGVDAVNEAREHPAIVHFNTSVWPRPWEPRSAYPNRQLWLDELEHTAWSGWRPRRRPSPRLFARRLKRAAHLVVHGT